MYQKSVPKSDLPFELVSKTNCIYLYVYKLLVVGDARL